MPGIGVVARRESLWDIGREGRTAAIMHQLKKGFDNATRKLRVAKTPCPKPHQG